MSDTTSQDIQKSKLELALAAEWRRGCTDAAECNPDRVWSWAWSRYFGQRRLIYPGPDPSPEEEAALLLNWYETGFAEGGNYDHHE